MPVIDFLKQWRFTEPSMSFFSYQVNIDAIAWKCSSHYLPFVRSYQSKLDLLCDMVAIYRVRLYHNTLVAMIVLLMVWVKLYKLYMHCPFMAITNLYVRYFFILPCHALISIAWVLVWPLISYGSYPLRPQEMKVGSAILSVSWLA